MDDSFTTNITSKMAATFASGKEWAQGNSPSVKKTRFGLSLVLIGYVVMIISGLCVAFGVMIFFGPNGLKDKGVMSTIALLRILIACFIDVVGPVYCLAVPAESGTKRYLMMSIFFNLIGIITSIVQLLAPMIFSSIFIRPFGFFGYIGTFMFIIFLKKLSEYIGRDDLGQR